MPEMRIRWESRGLPEKPKILLLEGDADQGADLRAALTERFQVEVVAGPVRALARLAHEPFDGVYVAKAHLSDAFHLGALVQNEKILEALPDGVVLLDSDALIVWSNGRIKEWTGQADVVGKSFYGVLGSPEILGPDFCPFHTVLATGMASSSTLRCGENRYLHVHAAPIVETDGSARRLIVTLRDVSGEVLQQQKLAAIHQAGIELSDLAPDEVASMTVDERIELLKANILHHTQDLLSFDVVEVRMLDQETSKLELLLAVGIAPEALDRNLFARPKDNGVTGFVAATGKSYLCEDTAEDPLYLEGARGARSSLTVPLVLHEQVIGTFNVESPEPRAFGESDLQFLEIFSRDVAVAINTLELLAAEKANTAAESVEAIHGAVALPVDDILNDVVNVMEHYIGHAPEVEERLQRILRNARDIKQVIHRVGQRMAPAQAHPQAQHAGIRPLLANCRVLVVDADENVRSAAHALLERYGCVVETAHHGAEAVYMIRSLGPDDHYQVIIADVRLPDMSGFELMQNLQTVLDVVPLVLMTGFGWDPGHSIVKARQAGLQAVLYKPFRLDQLLDTVERVVTMQGTAQPS
ncbi:MAG: response regulator [Planctomycetia bacterium]|nr:MAG: response regulator [Planctomycetia bacterium]